MKYLIYLLPALIVLACKSQPNQDETKKELELIVLGVAQDGGYPHTGCLKDCCKKVLSGEQKKRQVCALGIIDHALINAFFLKQVLTFLPNGEPSRPPYPRAISHILTEYSLPMRM